MTYPQDIVIAGSLIAAAIFMTNGAQQAEAQLAGPWQIAVVPMRENMVWRINTTTGQIEWCLEVSSPVCTKMPAP